MVRPYFVVKKPASDTSIRFASPQPSNSSIASETHIKATSPFKNPYFLQ